MRLRVVAFAVAALLSVGSTANAETSSEELAPGEDAKLYSCKNRSGTIEVTFKPETEVKDLVAWVMGFTCKNFVYTPHIVASGRKVTIIAPNKMTTSEAYRLFLAALASLNLTVVPQGNVMKIVETNTAKHLPVPLHQGGSVADTDQLVRYVLRPAYMPADALAKVLASVKSDPGEIVVAGSLLIIADYGSHIQDMLSITKLVDVPGGSDGVYTIPVQHADAAKLVPKLAQILGEGPTATAGPSKLFVDERTNTIIVGGTVAAFERVKALVSRLDIPLDIEGGTSIHVYPLSSAIAEELAKTLNEAIQKTQGTGPAQPPRPGPAPAPGPTVGISDGLEGKVQVVADKPTNKLIVMSSGRDFVAIKEVIRELDQPRRQIYLEALILEVAAGDDLTLGTSAHAGMPYGTQKDGLVLGGVQTGALSSIRPSTLAGATGLVGGLLGKALPGSQLLGTSIPSYGVLVQALAGRTNTNIVSSPGIIALDNELAKYKVGVNVPFTKGVLPATTVTTDAPLVQNIDRKDLVLELEIRPHISTGDQVLLEIKHESNDLAERDAILGPSWSTRGFETRAVVRDQQTFVLGGLMQEREITASTQVPLLGDIPILGYLFKHSTKQRKKTNLIIMITPYIIKDDLDLEAIRERKMREHTEYMRSTRSLAEMKYEPRLDYRRKRGLVEDINRSVQRVEADLATLEALKQPAQVKPGLVD